MKIILASGSPRRRELLTGLGIEFTIITAEGEERRTTNIPAELVEDLSLQKAEEVAENCTCDAAEDEILVIGADTVVAADGVVLGKPGDYAEAVQMIEGLQGKTHQVYTGVTIIVGRKSGERVVRTFHECTEVEVYPMTEMEIEEYCKSDEPYDKAGAYGIQGTFGEKFVKKIDGDYYNVVGLPVSRLYHELKEFI